MAKQDLPPILVTGKCWVGVRKTNDNAIKLPPIGQSHTDTDVKYFRFNHGRRKYPVAKYSVYPPIKHKACLYKSQLTASLPPVPVAGGKLTTSPPRQFVKVSYSKRLHRDVAPPPRTLSGAPRPTLAGHKVVESARSEGGYQFDTLTIVNTTDRSVDISFDYLEAS
ncbi:hypothetical protein NP493_352g04019 [Ridgeia piscesae]|uniref:Uncharacterized protein n=1 Tax=Ridgeia piscesae TaxID=27915 RepID=A0AAD9NTS4_RIDPI|nr:hypothetical protein NP493_352g04019 [Ridgeia piscesae]